MATLVRQTSQLCRLSNPRTDHWADHFRLDGTHIVALTDVGDGTASLLRLNQSDRLLEREALISVGRYPSEPARRRMATVE